MSAREFEVKDSMIVTITVTRQPARFEVNGKVVAEVPPIGPGQDQFVIDVTPHLVPGPNRLTFYVVDKPTPYDEPEDLQFRFELDGKNLLEVATSDADFEIAEGEDGAYAATILLDYRGAHPPAARCALIFTSVDDAARVTVGGSTIHTQSLLRHTDPRSSVDLVAHLKPGANTVELFGSNHVHLGDILADLTLDDRVVTQRRRDLPVGGEVSVATFQLSSDTAGITLVE